MLIYYLTHVWRCIYFPTAIKIFIIIVIIGCFNGRMDLFSTKIFISLQTSTYLNFSFMVKKIKSCIGRSKTFKIFKGKYVILLTNKQNDSIPKTTFQTNSTRMIYNCSDYFYKNLRASKTGVFWEAKGLCHLKSSPRGGVADVA